MDTFLPSLEDEPEFFSQYVIGLFSLNNIFIAIESRPAMGLMQDLTFDTCHAYSKKSVRQSPSNSTKDNIKLRSGLHF